MVLNKYGKCCYASKRLLEMLCFAFTHPLTFSLGQTEAVSGEPNKPGAAD